MNGLQEDIIGNIVIVHVNQIHRKNKSILCGLRSPCLHTGKTGTNVSIGTIAYWVGALHLYFLIDLLLPPLAFLGKK